MKVTIQSNIFIWNHPQVKEQYEIMFNEMVKLQKVIRANGSDCQLSYVEYECPIGRQASS